jgi:hypothetical protein
MISTSFRFSSPDIDLHAVDLEESFPAEINGDLNGTFTIAFDCRPPRNGPAFNVLRNSCGISDLPREWL